MTNPDLTNATCQIVAQDQAIRKALRFGHGPEYFVRYYQALNNYQKAAFVAAMAAIVSLEHAKKQQIREQHNEGPQT